jgi:hypothetical protein
VRIEDIVVRKLLLQKNPGQSLIILAVGFVVLLGFSGLAIDGGILYSDRRHAQNAADSGAMAGALAIIEDKNPVTPRAWSDSYARAADNAYDNDGVRNWVNVYVPPIDGPYVGEPYYVEVRIRSKVDSVFAHFVYTGDLENTVTAIAHAKPAWIEPFIGGQAVVGLAKTGCSVVWAHGSSDAYIDGGGIFVNSDHPDCAFKASGGNDLTVDGGDINVVGGWEISGGSQVDPPPTGGATQIDTPIVDPPTCTNDADRDSATGIITPGNISSFNFPNKPGTGGPWILKTGIYCVTGGFSVNGGITVENDPSEDPMHTGVLIYVESGDVSWNGSATLHLQAMTYDQWQGMLIYQDPSNSSMATINGDSTSTFSGTMFFPSAEVQVNGTGSETGFYSQIVGNTVDMSGNTELNIKYESGLNYAVAHAAQVELTH